jgi:hypothetical protein
MRVARDPDGYFTEAPHGADEPCPRSCGPLDSLEAANQIQGCFLGGSFRRDGLLGIERGAWDRMAPLIIGRPDLRGLTGCDSRMVVEGVQWIVRTGLPGVIFQMEIGTACSGASVDGA